MASRYQKNIMASRYQKNIMASRYQKNIMASRLQQRYSMVIGIVHTQVSIPGDILGTHPGPHLDIDSGSRDSHDIGRRRR